MKFTAQKQDLTSAISIAIRAVPSHTTMTILECILIEARTGELVFTANDMDMGIVTTVPAAVEETGLIAVDAKMFSEIIRKLPDDTVHFESDENLRILIRCGRGRFQISGRTGEEFPELPQLERDESVSISQFTLKSVIQETIFSIAANENNKILTGELFEIRGEVLRVVALDGHRIAIRRVALNGSFDNLRVIVPGKTLLDVSRILSGEIDDIVNLYFTRNHVIFELPGTIVISRLIDGDYFNIDQMISGDYELKVTVNKAALTECADRASLFTKEGDKRPIIFDVADDKLQISIDSPLGAMNEELEIEKEGRNIIIGFNPRFVLDALRAIDDENVSLYMMSPKAPLIIRDEDMTYTYLILPVNFAR